MGWLGPQSQVEATLIPALLSSEHKRPAQGEMMVNVVNLEDSKCT